MLSILLAVVAAGVNATSSVLQRKANRDLPAGGGGPTRAVIAGLLRSPAWCAGIAGVVAGFLLQAAALGAGELTTVEPILVIELPLTLLLAARVFRAPLRARELAATVGMAAGLAGLLVFLAPRAGTRSPMDWYVWAAGAGINLAVVAAVAYWGSRQPQDRAGRHGSDRRAAAYGVAAGSQFGLTAALIKSMTGRFSQGFGALFTGWQLYAMAVSGLVGLLLLQAAMNAGRLVAAQPGLTLSDPLVSVLWGVLAFGEEIRGGVHLALAIVCAVVMAGSVLVLVRAPALSGGESRPPSEAAGDGGR